MENTEKRIMLCYDYQEGAHPNIIKRLADTNMLSTSGYGTDAICASAKDRIRSACGCPQAEVEFLVGGTQTNATVIDAVLKSYQGVVAADTGHVSVHEAGAIELGGHKVLQLKSENGKITADQVDRYVTDFFNDGNFEHMVMPGMVYISQPTEYGTLYSLTEMTAISDICRKHRIPLYVDGARLAYAFGAEENDITLPDLAKLADIFYIGGTKCGALFGEAVVIPDPTMIPHFFTMIKQHGALLAKGRLLGIQFDELFRDNLYLSIGKTAVDEAQMLKKTLADIGYPPYIDSPTNQIFIAIDNDKMDALSEAVEYSFIEKYDDTHTVIRFVTSWATDPEDVKTVCNLLRQM